MMRYIISVIFALLSSFLVEKVLTALASGEKLSLKSKVDIKRLGIIAVVNLAVWIICFILYKTEPVTALLLCIGFDILFCIAAEDIKSKKISNVYLIAMFAVAVLITLIDVQTPWYMHILGCAMGYLPLFIMRVLGKAIKKQEVLGSGDVILGGILGFALGFVNFLICGIVASLVALITVRIVRRIKQYGELHTYPFSPFFLIGYFAALFGNLIIAQYIAWILSRV